MVVIGCTCSKLPLTLKQFRTLAFVQPTKILRLTFRLYLKTTTWETKRHHQTPKDTIKRQLSSHTSSNSLFGCLGTSVGVAWCLLVSVVVLNCPEITGVGFWEHNNGVYVCLWCLDASKGCLWEFRPCMVKQMLYIGKASKGKIPHTWITR